MADDAIRSALNASKSEQLSVSVHIRGSVLLGVVARLDESTAELRSAKGRSRTVIRIDRIDAVVLE